ncbi:MAG: hypothetical protein JNJ45_02190 [Chthonomonas sp.]|nr:hypothetical protein [Chthonomonas sp.]
MKFRPAFALIALSALAPAFADDKGKLSGVMFGDMYFFGKHNDAAIQGKQGFWLRRITLQYDREIDAKLSARVQIESKDPGDFTNNTAMQVTMRDAWVQFKDGRDTWRLGLIPTATWGVTEQKLGYRPIEKAPMELYRMGSSRDIGISYNTNLDKSGKTALMLAVGNGNGQRSSDGESAAAYARITHDLNNVMTVNLYADAQKRPNQEYWRSAKAEFFVVGRDYKGGLVFANQARSRPNASDLNLNLLSLYVEGKASEKARPFLRWDQVSDALPDADKIEFYRMSPQGKPTLFMVGVRMKIHPNFEIVPNIANISYRRGSGGIKPKSDTIFRVTFSANF